MWPGNAGKSWKDFQYQVNPTDQTQEMLKKVLTVRREKVYNALAFLIANNPLYHDVELNDDSQILKIVAKYLIFGILDL